VSGKPIKIIEFVKNQTNLKSEAFFYESNLKSVLESSDNFPISIISVAGPSNDGKTFFLSTLVKYFKQHASCVDKEFIQTIQCQWPSTNELETSGVYLWTAPINYEVELSAIQLFFLLTFIKAMT